MSESFYRPLGAGRYLATERTAGPWDPRHQHAGPPSALLVREIEAAHPRADAAVARVAVDILRPVPLGELTITTKVLRPGRRVELLEARLVAAGTRVVHATTWRIRLADVPLPEAPGPSPVLPPPETVPVEMELGWSSGYLASVEWRFVRGHFLRPGPGCAWTRLRVPLVADEETTPLQHVLAVADSGSGVSGALDLADWLFVNPEVSVHLARQPIGHWVAIESQTNLSPTGTGLAVTRLHDERGPVGQAAQALYVASRHPAD